MSTARYFAFKTKVSTILISLSTVICHINPPAYLRCDVIICEPTPEEISKNAKGVDAILWSSVSFRLEAKYLDSAGPQLKAISVKSAGYDYVDIPELKRRRIPLGHTPHIPSNAVADLAVGLMISASRCFHEGNMAIMRGEWKKGDPLWISGQDIQHSTVGILGLGGIGQQIVKRLSGFDVAKFLYSGRREKPEGKTVTIHI